MPVPDIAERLKAEHLSEETLKKEIEEQDPSQPTSIFDPNDPKGKDEYPFHFSWKDGRGKVWEGEFVDKILTTAERQMAGALRARFAGVAADRLDPFTSHINMMVSHLTFSLVQRPDWAKDLRTLKNIDLLQAIYNEVSLHEETFFGLKPTP
jgi:hypothetical protein